MSRPRPGRRVDLAERERKWNQAVAELRAREAAAGELADDQAAAELPPAIPAAEPDPPIDRAGRIAELRAKIDRLTRLGIPLDACWAAAAELAELAELEAPAIAEHGGQ